MFQIGSGAVFLFWVLAAAGILVILIMFIYRFIAHQKVDHSIEQSSAGVVMEDPDAIDTRLRLQDKIEPFTESPDFLPRDSRDIKFK
ncbi:MAG: hypothetical protein LC102_05530 [Ignavibacteriales bacterium]|jgi:hypothetical protein|nr:MAG: hypothetical protein F9K26_06575 [Ignavibacteriaceae bacterium]MBW7873228.1 hypothetical protein [Ignavibacteria bacterium]MCZ2142870.1 hypothetical protein [Ignavibacteriales bacterium]OQY70992.1 MAG: hypothetical protein B6D45_10635 [Ignavibacteriales bacterium UTCHB3]MBV6443964.1 hypothetical protein [Ignavibacteriaceae bacterium]